MQQAKKRTRIKVVLEINLAYFLALRLVAPKVVAQVALYCRGIFFTGHNVDL